MHNLWIEYRLSCKQLQSFRHKCCNTPISFLCTIAATRQLLNVTIFSKRKIHNSRYHTCRTFWENFTKKENLCIGVTTEELSLSKRAFGRATTLFCTSSLALDQCKLYCFRNIKFKLFSLNIPLFSGIIPHQRWLTIFNTSPKLTQTWYKPSS